MPEMLCFYIDDAIRYGEENAVVLGVLRKAMLFHDRDDITIEGINHSYLSANFFERFLPYKPIKRIKIVLRKLSRLGIISIYDGNHYAVLK